MDPHFRRILIIFIILTAFCFSRFSCSIEREKEKTLAIIKPDGVYGNYIDKIKNIIIEYGFSITREMKVHLDEVSVRSFYAEHSSKSFFHSLVKYMTSGPVLVMILEKDNAVVDWRKLIGPTDAEKAKVTHPQSVRALCGINAERNCVHGSDSIQSASREMSFFFGGPASQSLFPVLILQLYDLYLYSYHYQLRNYVSRQIRRMIIKGPHKFFNWMQNKLNGRPANQKANTGTLNNLPQQPSQREEFNDWPHGLLTIGTFGNKELKDKATRSEIQIATDEQEQEQNPTSASSPDLSEFTPDEVGLLQKELTKLLKRKSAKQEEEDANLPLDRFLNCPSSLEVSRRISNVACIDPDYKEDDLERTISVIIGKCKEVRAEKTQNAIGKKSVSFLLKKMFVCASGFSPAPSLRDTLQESRMEKLLRTILHKKIYPKSPRSSSMKRCIDDKHYLEDKHVEEKRKDEEEMEKPRASEACKWDKTDSDYIVLEI